MVSSPKVKCANRGSDGCVSVGEPTECIPDPEEGSWSIVKEWLSEEPHPGVADAQTMSRPPSPHPADGGHHSPILGPCCSQMPPEKPPQSLPVALSWLMS